MNEGKYYVYSGWDRGEYNIYGDDDDSDDDSDDQSDE